MSDLTINKTVVAPIKVIEQFTAPCGEDIDAGELVIVDPTTGKVMLADASVFDGAEADPAGVSLTTALNGMAVTVLVDGWLHVGDALDSLDYDAPLYSSINAGKIATATSLYASQEIGQVRPVWVAATPDKVLRVNCNG